MAETPAEAREVLAFWREAGPEKWFAKDSAFDIAFRDRFALLYSRASRGELTKWRETPDGALAEILLLDQFPRNAFRDTPWAFATDARALEATKALLATGQDKQIAEDIRSFVYMPLMHSEAMEDQHHCVAMMEPLGETSVYHARQHADVIARFNRFPHRNRILGRTTTAEEQAFIDSGGYTP